MISKYVDNDICSRAERSSSLAARSTSTKKVRKVEETRPTDNYEVRGRQMYMYPLPVASSQFTCGVVPNVTPIAAAAAVVVELGLYFNIKDILY